MDMDKLKHLSDSVDFKRQLKEFINSPHISCEGWHYGSAVNAYKGEMFGFVKHARKRCEEDIVHHAKYIIDSIDKELKDNGVSL